MNSQDFRNLQEAYLDVYGELDEELTGPRKKRALEIGGPVANRIVRGKEGQPLERRNRSGDITMRTTVKGPTKRGGGGIRGRIKSDLYGNDETHGGGNKSRKIRGMKVTDTSLDEEYDLYDIILSHLLDEGYADTEQAAEAIMVNMSEDWRESIVETRMDPRGRPASGPMNVYANPKGKPDQAHLDAVKSYDAEQKKKTPEQRKAEQDAYRERQMNNK